MKQTDPIEEQARTRLAADEAAASRRTPVTLRAAGAAFWRHPSPWLIATALVGGLVARVAVGDWRLTDLLVPVLLVAAFPVVEWVIHVMILHWRPRRLGPVTVDSLLARKHREHHGDPRDVPLVFIPWQTFYWLLPALVAIALVAFPRTGLGLTWLLSVTVLGLCYEWTHYLIHSDYRPRGRFYKAVWRNHRLHHYKNEHYWFSVTSAGTSDRLFGTYPDPATVTTSPTAKNLHGSTEPRRPAGLG
ncbi:sterol desaturase family protein [Nocardioides limicola]|uniref:sterol desaturase family protein n=1 Tax=Nocardioides limicola TaxID=2803368 RepID=UPI00193BA8A8|nr:sterol desaturase family protein [Nocardioides sp. DJM-14]